MPRTIETSVNPKVLQWARESIGLGVNNVAKKVKLKEEAIRKWESGEGKIRLTQLEKLADIYKRPLAAFFLSSPPKEPPLPDDFRGLAKGQLAFSSKTLLGIRRVRYIQSLYFDLAASMNVRPNAKIKKIELSNNPELLANEIRNQLNIHIEDQFQWNDERSALIEWKKIIESQGVLVLEIAMPLEEARAFSLAGEGIPVVVLNYSDYPNGRIFSIFHEYAHILLNHGGICNPLAEETEEISIEKFCNHFAGGFLVPKTALLKLNEEYDKKYDIDKKLTKLASKFKVSRQVILRRLLSLELINKDYFQRKNQELIAEFKRIKRQIRGRAVPSEQCIRKNGFYFVSLVLDAYRGGKITYSDVSDYLGIKLKYVPKVEERLGEIFS